MSTKSTESALRQRAGALLNALDLMKHKADVLSKWGVERIRDLSPEDLRELVADLEATVKHRPAPQVPDSIRAARSTVLNLCDGLGIKSGSGNWERLNEFLSQPRIAGKKLYDLDLDELKALAKKLRAIGRKRDEVIRLEDRLARDN